MSISATNAPPWNSALRWRPKAERDQGLCLNLPIGLNINLPVFGRLSHGPVINHARESANADKQIRDLSIKTPS